MELKFICCIHVVYSSINSNRTFMELKFFWEEVKSELLKLLQSHLYGIEIDATKLDTAALFFTPIAPLWN